MTELSSGYAFVKGAKVGLFTIVDRYIAKDAKDRPRSYVAVLCDCGNKKTMMVQSLVASLKKGAVPACSRSCHPKNEIRMRRQRIQIGRLDRYTDALSEYQENLCAWPPCGKELSGRLGVDHNHACCDGAGGHGCGRCIRGLVHHACNIVIAGCDKATELGAKFPAPIAEYLNTGLPDNPNLVIYNDVVVPFDNSVVPHSEVWGVTWNSNRRKWQARTTSGERRMLGLFDTEEAAIAALRDTGNTSTGQLASLADLQPDDTIT